MAAVASDVPAVSEGLLVRSWNVFHGNTRPPGRGSRLQTMIRLATADQPDVLCLQ